MLLIDLEGGVYNLSYGWFKPKKLVSIMKQAFAERAG